MSIGIEGLIVISGIRHPVSFLKNATLKKNAEITRMNYVINDKFDNKELAEKGGRFNIGNLITERAFEDYIETKCVDEK